MAKIPFDLRYRPQIERGEYKVETRDGKTVRIICWDAIGPSPIIGLFLTDDGGETTTQNRPDGRWSDDLNYESDYDLFLITPDELNEFEIKLKEFGDKASHSGIVDYRNWAESEEFRQSVAELLTLAKKYCGGIDFWDEGYQEGYKDAKRDYKAQLDKEYSDKFDGMYQRGLEDGKAEAKKALPKWESGPMPPGTALLDISGLNGCDYVRRWGLLMKVSSLEELPGFSRKTSPNGS